jgi:hypothetical protein
MGEDCLFSVAHYRKVFWVTMARSFLSEKESVMKVINLFCACKLEPLDILAGFDVTNKSRG